MPPSIADLIFHYREKLACAACRCSRICSALFLAPMPPVQPAPQICWRAFENCQARIGRLVFSSPGDALASPRKCTAACNALAQAMCGPSNAYASLRGTALGTRAPEPPYPAAWAFSCAVPCFFSIGSPAAPDFCGRRGSNSGTVPRRVELAVLHFIARPRGCICPDKLTQSAFF